MLNFCIGHFMDYPLQNALQLPFRGFCQMASCLREIRFFHVFLIYFSYQKSGRRWLLWAVIMNVDYISSLSRKAVPGITRLEEELLSQYIVATDATIVTVNGEMG